MECGIKYCYVRNARHQFHAGIDSHQVCRIVQRTKVSVMEIFCECFGRAKHYWTRKDGDEIVAIMARIPGWERPANATMRSKAYGKQRVFVRRGNE